MHPQLCWEQNRQGHRVLCDIVEQSPEVIKNQKQYGQGGYRVLVVGGLGGDNGGQMACRKNGLQRWLVPEEPRAK